LGRVRVLREHVQRHYNWSSPLIYNGDAFIGIASNCDSPLVQGQLLEVNLTSHQITATYNFVPNGEVGGDVWTSPTVDPETNTIFGPQGRPCRSRARAAG
jgi:hypothetical protein